MDISHGRIFFHLKTVQPNHGPLVTLHLSLIIQGRFIELGVHALNSQVWCMDPHVLGERFRGRITFWGEINRQSTMPHGTPDDIRREAAVMREHLATAGGGLIGQGEIDGLTPFENIETLMTAWNEC